MLGFGADTTTTASIAVDEPTTPQVADVPLPPRRPGAVQHEIASVDQQDVSVAPQGPPSAAPTAADQSSPGLLDTAFYSRWLGLAPETPAPPAVPVAEPARPQPADVPLPPRRRQARAAATAPQAQLEPAHNPYGGLPDIIVGAREPMPVGFSAFSAIAR
jgi:hypothetical protein